MELTKKLREYRTLKFALVAFLCIAIYSLIGEENNSDGMMIATITAVFGIHPDTADSWNFAFWRVIGTIIGCFTGIIYFLIAFQINNDLISKLVFIPLMIFIMIIACGRFKRETMTLAAVMAFIIMSMLTSINSDWGYVFERIIATFIGVGAAVLVNWIVHPKNVNLYNDLKRSINNNKK